MAKITHVTLAFTDLSQMDEIPSEFIEPYIVKYMTAVIEGVGMGWTKPAEARADLEGIERFISLFGGLHARIATQNQVYKFCQLTDETMIEICKKVCDNSEAY